MHVEARPTLSAPGEWDRYYQVQTDLDAVLGASGAAAAEFGETVTAAGGTFTNRAERGLFLLAEKASPGDPLEVSVDLSGAPTSGFFAATSGARRRRSRDTATGTHIEVEQLIRGTRIVGGEMRLHHDDRGVFAVTGRPLGDLAERDPGPPPRLDANEALRTCAERFEVEDGLRAASVEPVVFPHDGGSSWAYEVAFVVPSDSADVRTYLSADDFSVLLSYNISSAATGKARVYPVNPLQTPDLTDVTLEGLADPGTTLQGSALDVRQAGGERLQRDDRDFAVEPTDPGFDEVQAYYQLSRTVDYFAGIVDANLMLAHPFTPMRVLVNDPESPGNAYYSPTTGELRFGLLGSRSFARSAAVICHEFGHAITDAICRLGRAKVKHTESRGLSEGYSDYFAASFLDDPRLGDYIADDPHGARNCSDELRFPRNFSGEEHATGAVWAAVMWALRNRVGTDVSNKLAVESLEFIDASSTFSDAHAALRSVDADLFGGSHSDAIDGEFGARAPA